MVEIFAHAGLSLGYAGTGSGPDVLFQHGLGGDAAQVAETFPPHAPVRRLTLECRAHAQSDAGPFGDLSIATFAADALALAGAKGARRFVAGGISMGAAIALRLAVRHPSRVRALILVRPAWLFEAAPDNMRPFAEVADLLGELPPAEALARFDASATAQHLRAVAPDNLASLRGFFTRPNPSVTAALLSRIAADGPGVTEAQAELIAVPALIIGNAMDAVHPEAYAERLAAVLPRATLTSVTPKALDRAAYTQQVHDDIVNFLAAIDREPS
jgi:pimeloyl-ACP methyl ester carboxylesterase